MIRILISPKICEYCYIVHLPILRTRIPNKLEGIFKPLFSSLISWCQNLKIMANLLLAWLVALWKKRTCTHFSLKDLSVGSNVHGTPPIQRASPKSLATHIVTTNLTGNSTRCFNFWLPIPRANAMTHGPLFQQPVWPDL